MKWKLPLIHRGRRAKPKTIRPPHEEAKPKKLSFDDLPYEVSNTGSLFMCSHNRRQFICCAQSFHMLSKEGMRRPKHSWLDNPNSLIFLDPCYDIGVLRLILVLGRLSAPGSHNNHVGLNRRSIPNIIIALGPQPIVYYQALSLFYKQNTYHLDQENCHYFGWKMWPWAIRSIRRLEINIE